MTTTDPLAPLPFNVVDLQPTVGEWLRTYGDDGYWDTDAQRALHVPWCGVQDSETGVCTEDCKKAPADRPLTKPPLIRRPLIHIEQGDSSKGASISLTFQLIAVILIVGMILGYFLAR